VRGASRALAYVESGLDAAARSLVAAARGISTVADAIERALDTTAHTLAATAREIATAADTAERGFDAAARTTAAATDTAADDVETTEERVFGDGIDRAADRLRDAGDALRELQTGKLFQYTFSLFVYVLLAAALATLLFWLR
jgi:NADH-quinone oxidoreductase subunit L